MIAGGNARGVHHIESPAMISLSRMCNVRNIDCLIAIVSVIRPGAANGAKKTQFARRAQGLEPMEYAHPSLEPALRSTFGVVAYEEHILQICEAFAGLSPGRADVLRRALVKEKLLIIEEIGREFAVAARAARRADSGATATRRDGTARLYGQRPSARPVHGHRMGHLLSDFRSAKIPRPTRDGVRPHH
jgi:DNA polymerase III alpha subunit